MEFFFTLTFKEHNKSIQHEFDYLKKVTMHMREKLTNSFTMIMEFHKNGHLHAHGIMLLYESETDAKKRFKALKRKFNLLGRLDVQQVLNHNNVVAYITKLVNGIIAKGFRHFLGEVSNEIEWLSFPVLHDYFGYVQLEK